MNSAIESKLKNIINDISKNKLGFDVFTEGGINYTDIARVFPSMIDMIKNKKRVKVEVRESEEDDYNGDSIEFCEDTIIILKKPSEYAKFIVDYMLNEFDTITNVISQVYKGQHNDRIALVNSAIESYNKALYTRDANLRKNTFMTAESILTEGMNKLILEMPSDVKLILEIPQGVIKKMFCKIKPEQVMECTDILRESLIIYEKGIHLMLRLSIELNEPDRIIPTLNSAREFLNNVFLKDENYKIIDSFDYKDDNFWMSKPLEIEANLYEIKKKKVKGNYNILLDI